MAAPTIILAQSRQIAFLDEVSETSAYAQANVSPVLESKEIQRLCSMTIKIQVGPPGFEPGTDGL
jgi:DNA-binding NtrC family response regulator